MREASFSELPLRVHEAVESYTGPLTGCIPAPAGNHAQIAETLCTGNGRVFVKGTRLLPEPYGGAEAWSLRNEAVVNTFASPYAPELLWQIELDDWLLLGFEHIDGRHADYSPGSPDLALVAEVYEWLAARPCPDAVLLKVEDRYLRLDERAEALSGDGAVHCDLNPANVLITTSGARVVDWAFCSRGARWLDLGFLLPWLVNDGHTPALAEEWARQFEAWKDAEEAGHVDVFASLLMQAWRPRVEAGAADWAGNYLGIIESWNEHRSNLKAAQL